MVQNMTDFIEGTLKKMVKIKSVSYESMDDIIEFVDGLLTEIGVKTRVITGEKHAPVLMGSRGDRGVCFSGHLDTVPLGDGWTKKQGEIVDGKMYGRGALDMKGPCVSVIAAARRMVEQDIPFSVVFSTDEEVSMAGAYAVRNEREITDAPAVVVCEPTDMLVANSEKGVYQFEIVVRGKNAHASMPELGENALMKLFPMLVKIGAKGNVPAGDKLSCCVNVIKGGSATNVIPEICRAEVDVRFPSTYNRDSLKQYLFSDIEGDYELNTIQYLDSVFIDEGKECIQNMLELSKTDTWSVPYGTEMVMFGKTNENTFIFGPGEVHSAHQPDEWVDLKALRDVVDIYVDYARSMG
ncbi:MAG: M20/M25/M40 family metallo-hydrolase [Thermoplasmata archaeon]